MRILPSLTFLNYKSSRRFEIEFIAAGRYRILWITIFHKQFWLKFGEFCSHNFNIVSYNEEAAKLSCKNCGKIEYKKEFVFEGVNIPSPHYLNLNSRYNFKISQRIKLSKHTFECVAMDENKLYFKLVIKDGTLGLKLRAVTGIVWNLYNIGLISSPIKEDNQ